MKKVNIILLSLAAVLSIGTAVLVSSKKNNVGVSAYSASSVPARIDLNSPTESTIRSYYSNLTNLSSSEKQGNNLLKNLKPILKSGQKYYKYDGSSNKTVWQIYEIADRDWDKSPATGISSYNSQTNIITNYTYGTGVSSGNQGMNPYIHALYTDRSVENEKRAWSEHSKTQADAINREHAWPKSLGMNSEGNGGARGDPMHLMPSDTGVNSMHNNIYYGYVDKTKTHTSSTQSWQGNNYRGISKTKGSGTVFEPQDSDKGDIARAVFYMAARYNYLSGSDSDGISSDNPNLELINDVNSPSSSDSSTSETGQLGLIQDLLEWNRIDPPDEYEIRRNNLLYVNFTNNRNPFIDFPEWADYIWGSYTSSDYAKPATDTLNDWNSEVTDYITVSPTSAELTVGGTITLTATPSQSATVNWSSSNTNVATITNSGKVTAVAVGTATMTARATINGNLVTADCTITVIDSTPAKTLSSIAVSSNHRSFNVGDAFVKETVTATYSDSTTADVTTSATFSGYNMSTSGNQEVTVSYTESGTTKTTKYTITVTGGSLSNSFSLYSGTITEGDYVIYYNGKAMNTTVTSSRLQYEEVTPSNDTITTDDSSIIWHIAASGNYWTIYNADEAKYAASTGSKNQATMVSSINDNAKWTVTGTSTYEFENLARSSGSDPSNKWLRNNGTYGFACYLTSTGGALSLYKRDSATPTPTTYTVTYNANGGSGTMEDTVGENPTVAECTFTAPDGYHFSHWNTELDDNGDDYDPGDVVELDLSLYAIWEETVVVKYSVTYDANGATSGTVPVDNTEYESGTNATVLGNTGNLAKDGFTWIGWNTEDDGTGTTYSADDPLEMTANVTLYAKWQENTPTPPSEDDVEVLPSDGQCFYKVSSTEGLLSGKYLIVCESIGVAFDGSMGNLDVVNQALDVTIANKKIAASDLVSKTFTITVDGNNATIQSSSNIYIGRTSNSNGMNTSTSTAYTNSISFTEEGNANIVGSGGAYLRFNSASNEGRFRYYKSSTYTGQNAIQLYRLYDAEKYSKDFLAKVTCSGSGSITATGTFWSDMSSKYTSNLSSDEQGKLTSGVANMDGTTYLAQALARYDAIVSKYGTNTYANFMNRNIPSAGLNILVLTNNDTSSWLIIVISVISLSVISLYIFKRRKKYDN